MTTSGPDDQDGASVPPGTPFQVIGSDDAGYCADGVCVVPDADPSAPQE